MKRIAQDCIRTAGAPGFPNPTVLGVTTSVREVVASEREVGRGRKLVLAEEVYLDTVHS